jgi:hypothetical protein
MRFADADSADDYNINAFAHTLLHPLRDYDRDGDVDMDDAALFAGCMAGPDAAMDPARAHADLDGDNDVDAADFAMAQHHYTGPYP